MRTTRDGIGDPLTTDKDLNSVGVYYDFRGRSAYVSEILASQGVDAEPIKISIGNIGKNLKYDKIVLTVLYGKKSKLLLVMLQVVLWRLFRKKIVRYWVGTDIVHARTNRKMRCMFKIIDSMAHVNAVEAPWFVEELSEIGIESQFAPLTMQDLTPPSTRALPERCTVLAYLPVQRQEFYGSEIVIRLAKEFGDVRFIVVANDGRNIPKLPNIECIGWVDDLDEIYDQSTILLRMTEHDGMAVMVLESLQRRLHVVRSFEFPGCLFAQNFQEAKEHIAAIVSGVHRRPDGIPDELYEFVRSRNEFVKKHIA